MLVENTKGYINRVIKIKVPKVTKEKTVSQVIEFLKKESKYFEAIDYIYVIEKSNQLIGVFSVKDLFKFSKETKVESFMKKEIISISPSADHKLISRLILRHGIKSLPVVNKNKLIGVIPPKEITQILNRSLKEDILHLAGIHRSHSQYENTLEIPIRKSLLHRAPWLIVGLVGIILTAAYINIFEKILEKYIILAFFIPAIVYISDALGTQIQTLFIRDLAVMGKELKLHKYIVKQGFISLSISLIMSVLMFLGIISFWGQSYTAIVISIAAFSSLMVTSFTAFLITLIIERSGGDPALGGGPLATVISDATSIIIYFLIATIML
jgi:magnesium transporter